VPEVE